MKQNVYESEAKEKTCPHMLVSMKLGIIAAALTPGMTQEEMGGVMDIVAATRLETCLVSKCAMWQRDGKANGSWYGCCGLVK